VGEAGSFIRFDCDNCGYKSTVSESYAGKQIRCPKCYYIIFIPKIKSTGTAQGQSSPGKPKTNSRYSDYDLTLLDISEKDKIKNEQGISEETDEYEQELEEESRAETEPATQRKLPWIIDIFLYPISTPGLIMLGIFVGVPLLIDILMRLVGTFAVVLIFPSVIINIVIRLYLYWYIAECVRDSAMGGIRAPETLSSNPGLSDMFWQMVSIVGCLVFFLGPAFFYQYFTEKTDTIFWILLAYGIFFFPMGLLAVIILDSSAGLNPILLVGSIFRTFFPYCGLILILCGPCALIGKMLSSSPPSLILSFILFAVFVYTTMVAAHLLGRFYWRYEEKLNWDL
jgi:ribosomal protein S27E